MNDGRIHGCFGGFSNSRLLLHGLLEFRLSFCCISTERSFLHLTLRFPVDPTNVHSSVFSSVLEASFIHHYLWSPRVHPYVTWRVFIVDLLLSSPLSSILHSRDIPSAVSVLSFLRTLWRFPVSPAPLSAWKLGLITGDSSDSKNKVIRLFSRIIVIQQPLK